jgi:Helicase associated domain
MMIALTFIAFFSVFKDCNVPQKYKENPKLGGWVNKQRKKKKNSAKYGRLSEAQTALLDDLGFKWNLENSCISSSGTH